jgi:RimJ/RimL family protein N-acetyltransferase
LDLTEIFAFVLPKNERSIRVLDKLGFKKCGKVFEDGAWAEKYIIERSDT